MDVREKLVELLCNVPPVPVLVERGSQKGQTVAEYYADHLIQNETTIFIKHITITSYIVIT